MKAPLAFRTLSGAITDRLREDILSGMHPAGSQLRQDALATSYGVSRIPVREALFALEAEGLVQMLPHRGAIVTPLSREEVGDVFDLRVMLEPRLLAASIPFLGEDDFAALDQVQNRFDAAIASGDRAAWGRLNAELHLIMYRKARLPRSLAIVENLLQASERFTRMQLSALAAYERAQQEHAELIRFCRSRHIDAASGLLVRHIDAVRADIEAFIGV